MCAQLGQGIQSDPLDIARVGLLCAGIDQPGGRALGMLSTHHPVRPQGGELAENRWVLPMFRFSMECAPVMRSKRRRARKLALAVASRRRLADGTVQGDGIGTAPLGGPMPY